MNCKLSNVFMFATGALIGSLVTWKLTKDKYERIAQEEIESVREMYDQKMDELYEDDDFEENYLEAESERCEQVRENAAKGATLYDKPDVMEYAQMVGVAGYSNMEEVGAMIPEDRPYVISPDEFDEFDEYEAISLTYYADGVLTDDRNIIVEDVDSIVGINSLTQFGKYEDDSVHVRNDALQCDYEILRDTRNYKDILTDSEEE